jgi:hypothetical protein
LLPSIGDYKREYLMIIRWKCRSRRNCKLWFTVINNGNVALTEVRIPDPLPGIILTGGPINLLVGESNSTTFAGSYVLTQEDIIAGS